MDARALDVVAVRDPEPAVVQELVGGQAEAVRADRERRVVARVELEGRVRAVRAGQVLAVRDGEAAVVVAQEAQAVAADRERRVAALVLHVADRRQRKAGPLEPAPVRSRRPLWPGCSLRALCSGRT